MAAAPSAAQDAALEATIARKSDAEISFKTAVFFEEFFFNFFGIMSLPIVLWRRGRVGAENRLLLSVESIIQSVLWTGSLFGFVVLHAIYNGTPGYVITNFEVIVVFVLWTTRCATIAIKWAYFSSAQIAEMNSVVLPRIRIYETFVLFGAITPTTHLLFVELERSLVRVAPQIYQNKFLFGDRVSRDSMLWSMKRCLPSFLENEFGISQSELINDEEEEAKLRKERAAAARKSLARGLVSKAASAIASSFRASFDGQKQQPQNAKDFVNSAEDEPVDKSIEALAVRRYIQLLDSHSGPAAYCEVDLAATMHEASKAAFMLASGALNEDPSASSAAASASTRDIAAMMREDEKTVTETLPYIPAKLITWHSIYVTHITNNPSATFAFYAILVSAWIFAFLPSIARAAAGNPHPFGSIPACYVTSALLILTSAVNFLVTARFLTVAPIDFSRRLQMAALLSGLIDPLSPVATEFALPTTRTVGTPQKSDDEHGQAGETDAAMANDQAASSGEDDDTDDDQQSPLAAVARARALSIQRSKRSSSSASSAAFSSGRDKRESNASIASGAGLMMGGGGDGGGGGGGGKPVVLNLMSHLQSAPLSRVAAQRINELQSSVGNASKNKVAASTNASVMAATAGVGRPRLSSAAATPAGANNFVLPVPRASRASNFTATAGAAGGAVFGPRFDGGALITTTATSTAATTANAAADPSSSNTVQVYVAPQGIAGSNGLAAPSGGVGSANIVATRNPIASAALAPVAVAANNTATRPRNTITLFNAPIAVVAAAAAPPPPAAVSRPAPPKRVEASQTQTQTQTTLIASAVGSVIRGVAGVPLSAFGVSFEDSADDSALSRAGNGIGASSALAGTSSGSGDRFSVLRGPQAGPAEVTAEVLAPTNLGAVSAAADAGAGKIEGFLEKQALRKTSSSFFGRAGGWKRRYFVCDAATDELTYSKGPLDPPINTIKITERSMVVKFDGAGPRRPHSFLLIIDVTQCSLNLALSGEVHQNKSILYASCLDERTLQAWLTFLASIITRKLKEREAIARATAEANEGFAAASLSTALLPPAEPSAAGVASALDSATPLAALPSGASTSLASIGRSGRASPLFSAAEAIGTAGNGAADDDDDSGDEVGRNEPSSVALVTDAGANGTGTGAGTLVTGVTLDMGVVTTPPPPPPPPAAESAASTQESAQESAQESKTPTAASSTASTALVHQASAAVKTSEGPAEPAGASQPAPAVEVAKTLDDAPPQAAAAAAELRKRKRRALIEERSQALADKGTKTVRSSILARHRLLALESDTQAVAGNDASVFEKKDGGLVFAPVLYSENLLSWSTIRQIHLDFFAGFQRRVSLYSIIFGAVVIISILLLLFQFGVTTATVDSTGTVSNGMSQAQLESFAVTIGTSAFAQLVFSIALAASIVQGARLNEATTLHRFKLSRVELLISDLLVAAEMPALSSRMSAKSLFGGQADRLRKMLVDDSPVVRQLRLTRQVASSLSSALTLEMVIMPARVLGMPANFALLSTFFSLSISGVLSATKALKPPQ